MLFFSTKYICIKASYVPSTIASVLVAFLSFFAVDFSLFFRLALLTLYIVNLAAADALRSFFDPVDLSCSNSALTVADTVLKKRKAVSNYIETNKLNLKKKLSKKQVTNFIDKYF